MLSSANPRTQTNRALELLHATKLWVLQLIETTQATPSSLWAQVPLLHKIPYLGAALIPDADKNPHHQTSLEFYISHLKKNLELRLTENELNYFNKLKQKLCWPRDRKEQKLAFLINYYDILNQLSAVFTAYNPYATEFSGPNEPRLRIIKTLKAHYETDSTLAAELQIKPALLDKALKAVEIRLNQEQANLPSTGRIRLSINRSQTLPLRTITELEPLPNPQKEKEALAVRTQPLSRPRANTEVSTSSSLSLPPPQRSISLHDFNLPPLIVIKEPPLTIDLSQLIDKNKTLGRYKEACEAYLIHLRIALLEEIKTAFNRNKKHTLFTLLTPRANNTSIKLASTLLNLYYPQNTARLLDSHIARAAANEQKKRELDQAIQNTHPQFHEAWEKYKLVLKLQETHSVEDFHHLLQTGNNKEILTKRRDSHLMTFVKVCGLAVATILGLPLGLVGGAYLAYRSLFGSRATEGHLFLKNIDQMTEEGKKPPQNRRCTFC